jgi:hypothetical protein
MPNFERLFGRMRKVSFMLRHLYKCKNLGHRRLHRSVDKLEKLGQRILDEFFKAERAKRGEDRGDQDPGGKDLYVSRDFYEAARSKAQARGAVTGEVDA